MNDPFTLLLGRTRGSVFNALIELKAPTPAITDDAADSLSELAIEAGVVFATIRRLQGRGWTVACTKSVGTYHARKTFDTPELAQDDARDMFGDKMTVVTMSRLVD